MKMGTNKENVWEHGNLGQFWKGTRTLPGRPSDLGEPSAVSTSENQTSGCPGYHTNKISELVVKAGIC